MLFHTKFWSASTQNIWVIPALLVQFAFSLALALLFIDANIDQKALAQWPVIGVIGADTAISLLQTIASAMITTGATVFSIPIVALTLASMQFSPRVLGNFIRDRATQIVLGVFLGVFTYCLIVLRAVRSGDNGFVPCLSLFVALVLALVGVAFLVYFIYRIAVSIQASSIAANIVREACSVAEEYFPKHPAPSAAHVRDQELAQVSKQLVWQDIISTKTGYIQHAEEKELFGLACQRDIVIRIARYSGAFIVEGEVIAFVSMEGKPDADLSRTINACFMVGPYRTMEQDIAYGIWQLVDMGLKALSPAVNDTSTGIMCINHLGAIIGRIAPYQAISRFHLDNGKLRLATVIPNFESLLDQSFDQLRHSAADNNAVIIRILHAINMIGNMCHDPQRRRAIMKHIQLVADVADRTIKSPHEREETMAFIMRTYAKWGNEWIEFQLASSGKGKKAAGASEISRF